MTRVILAVVALAAFATQAEAGPFGRLRRSNNNSSACTSCQQPSAGVEGQQQIVSGGDDQARCQQEANTMASRRIRGHVGSTIGRFEGVGFGGSPGCSTCTPEQYGYRGLSLTGDASARGPDGWYRVRSWR